MVQNNNLQLDGGSTYDAVDTTYAAGGKEEERLLYQQECRLHLMQFCLRELTANSSVRIANPLTAAKKIFLVVRLYCLLGLVHKK